MPGSDSLVVFHVQAGTRIGMGHLSRARSVITALQDMGFDCALHLDADAEGLARALSWGLSPTCALPDGPSALVIDAITLDRVQADVLRGYAPRILISPVFNRVDIVSHALLRSAPPVLLDNLPDTAVLHVNTDYAFATAQGLCPRALDFAELEVGVCLSGGVSSMEPNRVLALLDELPQVTKIKVIDPRCLAPLNTPVKHVPHAEHPWNFLQGINLFIGGDGVMLAEAIAQGLPAISLSRLAGGAKNAALQASRALCMIARDMYMLHKLADLLADRKELKAMHRAALELDGVARATRLAKDIRRIVKENTQ